VRTQIRLIAAPGDPDQHHTRKQILDEVNGIVIVIDAQPNRLEENVASVEELRELLAEYGRTLDQIPFVVQYNKRDLVDAYTVEDLHRKLGLGGAAVFEAVASESTGVLQTLSTISKRVIRSLRGPDAPVATTTSRTVLPAPEAAPAQPDPPTTIERPALDLQAPAGEPLPDLASIAAEAPPLSIAERMEAAILEEAENPEFESVDATAQRAEDLLDTGWERVRGEIDKPSGLRMGVDLSVVSVGEARLCGKRAIRVPLVLGDVEGNTASLALTIQLEPLMDED
jgi:hypothetical protein